MDIYISSHKEKIKNRIPAHFKNSKTIIKPNFVLHRENIEAICTSNLLLKEIINEVGPKNSIIVSGSHKDCILRKVKNRNDFNSFLKKYRIDFRDIREEYVFTIKGVPFFKRKLKGDPGGDVLFDLGKESYFSEVEQFCDLIHGAKPDREEILLHHLEGKHEYLVSGTVMKSKNFLSVPKLKTHKKVGVTLNLKGLVGIITNKNYLPHYRLGSPEKGGDEFIQDRDFESKVKKISRKLSLKLGFMGGIFNLLGKFALTPFLGSSKTSIRAGNWYGNDTAWRMVLDLYKILIFGDKEGLLQKKPQRETFSIIDGMIAGEGNGPLNPTPRRADILIAGEDLLWTDIAALTIMGFDYTKIPIYKAGVLDTKVNYRKLSQEDIRIVDLDNDRMYGLNNLMNLKFEPHFGWRGYIEK